MSDTNDRKWMPAAWTDEVVPTLHASPGNFLRNTNGKWQLVDDSEEWPPIDLVDGQEVAFTWCEFLGSDTVVVRSADDWSMEIGEFYVPEDASLAVWIEWEPDTVTDSVESLVKDHVNDFGSLPHEMEVNACAWAHEHVVFVFANGTLTQKVLAS